MLRSVPPLFFWDRVLLCILGWLQTFLLWPLPLVVFLPQFSWALRLQVSATILAITLSGLYCCYLQRYPKVHAEYIKSRNNSMSNFNEPYNGLWRYVFYHLGNLKSNWGHLFPFTFPKWEHLELFLSLRFCTYLLQAVTALPVTWERQRHWCGFPFSSHSFSALLIKSLTSRTIKFEQLPRQMNCSFGRNSLKKRILLIVLFKCRSNQ